MIHFDFKAGPKIYVKIPYVDEAERLRRWLWENTDVTWASGTPLAVKDFYAGHDKIVAFRTHPKGVQSWDMPTVIDEGDIVCSVDEFILMHTEWDIDEDNLIPNLDDIL